MITVYTPSVQPNPYCDEKGTRQSVRIGERFVNLRKLSQGLGFSHGYLSRVFSGDRNGSITRLIAIAAALDLTVDDLVSGIQQRKVEKAA